MISSRLKSPAAVAAVALLCSVTPCRAQWDCDDWVERGGYCVDYVKSRVPTFPVPESEADMLRLNNRGVKEVAAGDVAIFDLGRYWHVAYVERVHRDHQGNAIAIDVSEKNFGSRMTPHHYRKTWGGEGSEWKRAVWCGVTKKYGQNGVRTNVPIQTVQQIWSPVPAEHRRHGRDGGDTLLLRARQFLQGLFGLSRSGS